MEARALPVLCPAVQYIHHLRPLRAPQVREPDATRLSQLLLQMVALLDPDPSIVLSAGSRAVFSSMVRLPAIVLRSAGLTIQH